jgi:mRNA interferase MazF
VTEPVLRSFGEQFQTAYRYPEWACPPVGRGTRIGLVHAVDEVIPVLNNVIVAPVTSTSRAIPTCIPVGLDEGVDHDSAATFDNLASVPKSVLTRRLGQLGVGGRQQICSTIDAMANC